MDPAVPPESCPCVRAATCVSLHSCSLLRTARWKTSRGRAKTAVCGPGFFQVYPQNILPIWLILGPNQLISTEFPRETREETRGCCRETRKGNETGCARKHGYSLTGGVGWGEPARGGPASPAVRTAVRTLSERTMRNRPYPVLKCSSGGDQQSRDMHMHMHMC